MKLTLTYDQACAEAYRIGVALHPYPGRPGTFAHSDGDVAHVIEAVLTDTHPLASMPSQAHDWPAFERWEAEETVIRRRILACYYAGVAGLPAPAETNVVSA